MGTPWPSYGPPKLAESRGIEGFPPRTPLTLGQRKPQNWAPLLTNLGGESKGKEPWRVHVYTPTKSQREMSKNRLKKITKKRLRKSPKRKTGKNSNKPWGTTLNHLYIPWRFIQGLSSARSSYPHNVSPRSSQASPRNSKGKRKRKIAKQNELGFQEMAAIL
jgi:hypothetical protein